MRVGIVSDTHDNVAAIEAIVATFREQDVSTVVHCGDFIAPLVVPYFDDFTLHGVIGNNDGETQGLYEAFRALNEDSELHGRFGTLEVDGTTIAFTHGEDYEVVEAATAADRYDLVCYGHYHTTDHRTAGDTTVINPGAHFPTTDPDDRSVAVLDTETDSVDFHPISPAE